MKKILLASAASLIVALFACGKDDEKKTATPTPTPTATATTAAKVLPSSFASACAGCHGDAGLGVGDIPSIKAKIGNYSSEGAFLTFVRAGKGTMGAISDSQMNDADVKKVYAYFK